MKHALSDDDTLQRAVLLALNAAAVPAGRVGIAVEGCVVTLLGYVEDAAQKQAAERAALRVAGVKAVVVAIQIRGDGSDIQHDDQLAAEVLRRLDWDAWLPKDVFKVRIEHGHVTLLGQVERVEQRLAALQDVSRLFGVTGVSDRVTVKGGGRSGGKKRRPAG